MKYLVFNIAVFLALGYLITGTGKVTLPTFDQTPVKKASPVVQQEIPAQEPVVEKTPPAPVKKVEVKKPVAPVAPPAIPEAIAVAKAEPKVVPSRVIEPSPVAPEIEASPVETKLSNAMERSRDLRKMVAEMERMFADKMTR